jgi:hypothetical protein
VQVAHGASGYAVSGVATRGHVERGKRPKCLKRAVRAPCSEPERTVRPEYAVVEILRRFPIPDPCVSVRVFICGRAPRGDTWGNNAGLVSRARLLAGRAMTAATRV